MPFLPKYSRTGAHWEVVAPTSGSDTCALGNVQKVAGSWYIHYLPGAGSPSSFVPKLAAPGQQLSGANLISPTYYTIQAGTVTAGTASSGAMIYIVPADGADLVLEWTGAANGGTAYCWFVVGA